MIIQKDQLYTTEEVADMLKVSLITVKRYVAENKIPSLKINRLRRFNGNSILEFISGNSTIGTETTHK